MSRDATAEGADDLAEYFRRRAVTTGILAGLLAFTGIGILAADAPELFDGLSPWGGVG